MRTSIPKRFSLIRVLREGRNSRTFLACDNWTGMPNVVVKLFGKAHFTSDRHELQQVLSWFVGINHPHLSNVLSVGLTSTSDLYYVREYFPDSQFSCGDEIEITRQLLSTVAFLHS